VKGDPIRVLVIFPRFAETRGLYGIAFKHRMRQSTTSTLLENLEGLNTSHSNYLVSFLNIYLVVLAVY
jgi:hypothetical protein